MLDDYKKIRIPTRLNSEKEVFNSLYKLSMSEHNHRVRWNEQWGVVRFVKLVTHSTHAEAIKQFMVTALGNKTNETDCLVETGSRNDFNTASALPPPPRYNGPSLT